MLLQEINCTIHCLLTCIYPYLSRWSKKKKAGTETWFGSSADEIPYRKLGPLERDLFATYSGPDRGLSIISDDERDKENNRDGKQNLPEQKGKQKGRACHSTGSPTIPD